MAGGDGQDMVEMDKWYSHIIDILNYLFIGS